MGDVYEYVDGYDNSNAYSDDMVFEVSKEDKSISVIKKQVLISGERNSQYIEFQMPRYYDGIDLSEKNIEVIYVTETGTSDINKAINVRRNEEQILFGWLVPGGALQDPGTLSFCIEFAGEEYVMKTMPVEIEVYDGMNGSDIMAEPTDQVWYMQIQNLCSQTLEKAQEHETNAATSEGNAQTYMQDAQEANEQANQAKESIQGAVKQITDNRLSIEDLEKENAQLKARLDTAVGNYTGSEEGEIADARIDRSGKVYGALGAAIRGQLDEQENKLKKETDSLKEDISDVFSNNIFDVSKCIKGKAYATTYNVSTLEDFVDNEKAYSVPAITLPYGGKITVNQKYNWSSFVAYLYKNNIYQGYITPVQNDNGTWTFTNNMDGCNKIAFTILSNTADFDISKFMVVIGDYDKMPDIYEPSGLKVPEKSIQFDALTDNCVNKIISQANSATGSNKESRTVIYDNGLGNKVINATVGNKIEFVNYAYRTLYSIDVEESGYYITNVRSQNTGSNSWAVVDKNDIVLSCGEAEVEKVGVHIPKISGMKKIYWTNEKGITSIFKDNEKYEVYSGDKILYTISEENCTHSGIDNVNYFSCSSDAAITLGIENTYGTSLGIWIYVPYDSTKLIENINVETYKNGAKVHERYIGKQHFELGAWQFVKINIQDGYIDSIKLTVSGTRTTSAVIGIKNVLIVDQFSKPIVIINNDSAWQSSDTCGFYDYLINNKIPWTITGTLENVNENTKSKLLSAYKDNLLDIGLYGNENYNDVNYSINDGTPDYQTMQRNMDEVMDKKLDYCDNPISFGARGHNYNPKILRCIKNNGFKIWKTCASNLYSNCEFADTIAGIGITTQPMSGWFDYAVSPSVGGCTLGLFSHGISENPSVESNPDLYYSWGTVKERLDTLLKMRNRGNVEFMNMAQFYKLVGGYS